MSAAPTPSANNTPSAKGGGVLVGGAIVCIVVLVSIMYWWTHRPPAPPAVTTSTQQSHEMSLVLRYECITPCSADIQWPYQFWADYNVNVRHPGIPEPVTYRNGEEKDAPQGILKGENYFTSADPQHPNFKVRILEKRYN